MAKEVLQEIALTRHEQQVAARDDGRRFESWRTGRLRISTMSKDNPGVVARPPFIFGLCAGVAAAAHFVHPVPITGETSLRWPGNLFAICSAALAIWAVWVMKAAGTNVSPLQPTLAIVKRGPYRFTRNPLYVSLCLLQVGISLRLNDWIALSLTLVLFVILHFGVVLREEAYLGRKFGEEYLAYKRSVRRWI